jgi:aspartate-semialdehyde dehydrogenase
LASASTSLFQIALLGGETLLGGELKDVFEAQLKDSFVNSYAATGEGSFSENMGEAVYLDPFDAQAVESAGAIVAAGAAAGSLKAYELAKALKGKVALIDCAGHLEQEPEARIVAPVPGETNPPGVWLFVTAQPAAAAIVETLRRLSRWRPIARSVVNVFEPASERGKSGAAELHQQTTSLLAFRGLDKEIFDAQLGFNLLPQYGPAAPLKLAAVERRIERHIALLLKQSPVAAKAKHPAASLPIPSVRLIQAPVFHAYSVSFWIEFAADIAIAELGHALASAQIEVREPNHELPNSIGAAGHSGLIAGDIRVDRNNPRAAWLWVVCDNLRATADTAVTLLRSIKAQRS